MPDSTQRELTRTQAVISPGASQWELWKGSRFPSFWMCSPAASPWAAPLRSIGRQGGDEHGVSQVFIALNYREIAPREEAAAVLEDALDFLMGSQPDGHGARIVYPGQRAVACRAENERLGIPVDERVWAEVLALAGPKQF